MVERGEEIDLAGYACEGSLVADGTFFPKIKMVGVGFAVATESGGFDAMGVASVEFGIDEIVVSGPIRIGF